LFELLALLVFAGWWSRWRSLLVWVEDPAA